MWQGVLEFQMQGTDTIRIILRRCGLRMRRTRTGSIPQHSPGKCIRDPEPIGEQVECVRCPLNQDPLPAPHSLFLAHVGQENGSMKCRWADPPIPPLVHP